MPATSGDKEVFIDIHHWIKLFVDSSIEIQIICFLYKYRNIWFFCFRLHPFFLFWCHSRLELGWSLSWNFFKNEIMWIMNNIIIQKWFKIKIQFNHIYFNFSALKFGDSNAWHLYILTCAISKSRMISIQGRYNAMKFLFICNFPRTTLSNKNMNVCDVTMTSSWCNHDHTWVEYIIHWKINKYISIWFSYPNWVAIIAIVVTTNTRIPFWTGWGWKVPLI